MRFKRVNIDGVGDDPDEYWFECPDCEGTREVSFPGSDDEGNLVEGLVDTGVCPNCDGSGVIEGEADDLDD